ncbi:MAG TPA: ankyrin repeat domain-containing protein [Candidatus Avipropionibacterium avicola]|uniref:Ankyrin repeat domain-containing protein n=1 Tax=Candidatus Avipropionibacterium avicola TaxID=2840701 RepID=A0A9D1GZ69_9ACTN|nr:ankyrin repeat domain-containing protein [Candidatus Avipropionibacterium avicola]
MPISVRHLPDNPNLEHLRGEAKQLAKRCRSGAVDALELVATFDPRTTDSGVVTLAAAQRVIARSYGFANWARLKDHVGFVTEHTRWPEPAAESAPLDPGARADHLLQLGCHNYTRDRTAAVRRARDLLAAEPALGTSNVFTMAVTGAHQELSRLLSEDPSAVHATGGPFDWPALLYLAYGRVGDAPGHSAVRTASVLLEAGADPNAGFLWQGLTSPFTALTGVLGGGEQDQSAHPDSIALARLLLEAGADPNDNQALYNRMFSPRDDHLELLFEYGLGQPFESVWRRRLGDSQLLTHHYPTPEQMVTEQLRWAAGHGMTDRIRLLLDHGVDPDGRGYHPNFGDQTAYRIAVLAGFPEIARLLADAGADTSVVDTN